MSICMRRRRLYKPNCVHVSPPNREMEHVVAGAENDVQNVQNPVGLKNNSNAVSSCDSAMRFPPVYSNKHAENSLRCGYHG